MSGAFRTVSASVFTRYFDFAVAAGADKTNLLAHCGLSAPLPDTPDERVDFDIYRTLVQSSVKGTNNPALPLRYPFETHLDTASIVGLIIKSSKSLADAFTQLNRFAKLMMEIDIMSGADRHPIELLGEDAWILDARPDPNDFPELTEIALGRIVGETRALFPDQQFAKLVTVTHTKPAHGDLYGEYWRCPVKFGADKNGVKFDRSWLAVKFDTANAYAFDVFAQKAENLSESLAQSSELRIQVEAQLLPDLHRGHSDIEQIARKLGMSRSTLYRHLKDESITFAEIHDELRRRKAIEYLSGKKISIKETAYLVGFSESSSFNRAFKRWTGQSPRAFCMS